VGPEDVELGAKPVKVERRSRAGAVISVRLTPEEADNLQRLAMQRGTTLSRVAREAITTFVRGGLVAAAESGPWSGTISGTGHFELIAVGRRLPARTEGHVREVEPVKPTRG
jgi:hypothetical protein